MSTPGQADHEVPPSDPNEFREAMGDPFRDAPIPRNTVGNAGTMPNPDDFAAELREENNIIGLARHEPRGVGTPHDTVAGQEQWDAFVTNSELAEIEPRRGRVIDALRKLRFIGRNH